MSDPTNYKYVWDSKNDRKYDPIKPIELPNVIQRLVNSTSFNAKFLNDANKMKNDYGFYFNFTSIKNSSSQNVPYAQIVRVNFLNNEKGIQQEDILCNIKLTYANESPNQINDTNRIPRLIEILQREKQLLKSLKELVNDFELILCQKLDDLQPDVLKNNAFNQLLNIWENKDNAFKEKYTFSIVQNISTNAASLNIGTVANVEYKVSTNSVIKPLTIKQLTINTNNNIATLQELIEDKNKLMLKDVKNNITINREDNNPQSKGYNLFEVLGTFCKKTSAGGARRYKKSQHKKPRITRRRKITCATRKK
jgi:hypothetical protein